ncbi:MAG: hypothetical protein K2K17_11075, partial [Lachnospiraceae bacterium]|nr:hypothetical protein [Lachnospiraceae bacterium]
MRIIPKKTKVQMEFFKGIGVLDVAVGLIGASLAIAIFLSDLPLHIPISVIVLILVVGLVIPLEDEKGYMIIYNALVYLARQKYFRQRMEEESEKSNKNENAKKAKIPTVGDITPFTGISGRFIEYGTEYYGIVVEIPNIEFRFYTENRQDQVIEHVYGSVLRSVSGTGSAAMVKLDRPIILDTYIASEQKKIEDIKEAYLNGLLSDEELTKRVAIIHDRMEQIKIWNQREKVYLPFHYLVFFHKDQQLLEGQAEDMIKSMTQADMQCRILEEKELVMFLKYNYTIDFDEREAYGLTPDQYMDWILPKQIQFTSRQVKYDDLITHTFRIRDYPTMVGNAWGHSLFHIMGTRAVLKMHPLDQYKSIRQIDRAIDELRTQANETGKTSKLMELETHIDTLASVLSMLQGDNESLFDVNIYITLYDYELSEREKHPYSVNGDAAPASLKKQVKQMMAEQGFKATDLLMMQFEAYASSHISAFDAFRKESRGIHSTSIAAVFPYVHKILDDKNGICIGESDGIPVFVDFFKRDKERVNSNMVVIGKSGSGKSYATKTLLANLAAENSKIF